MTNREITDVIETVAPLSLQESWDNSGWQTGDPDAECSGVLLCVDVTPEIIDEAVGRGCNLIISHHPLIFKGVKQIIGRNRVERSIAAALRAGVSVYSSHTAVDCAPAGVSHRMAQMLGLRDTAVLDEASGLGVIGNLPAPMPWRDFLEDVKTAFGAPVLKCSRPADSGLMISCVALCGGSAAEFLPEALARGAQVYVTADCKHNQYLDHAPDILLVDSGHYETELCTKEIFRRAISEKFPNFAVWKSTSEQNPVMYV